MIGQWVKIRTRDHTGQKSFREIKIIFHPLGFSRQSYLSLTGKRQRHSERITSWRPLQWPQPKSASINIPSGEEIDMLLTDKDIINTQKTTKLSECFRDYLREQDPVNVEFEEFSLESLYCCGCGFKCLRQRSNGLKICLPAVFYMYVISWFHSV